MRLAAQYVTATIEIMNVGRSNPAFAQTIDELREGFLRGGAAGKQRNLRLLNELATAVGEQFATFIGGADGRSRAPVAHPPCGVSGASRPGRLPD
ncbi:hypothetical protein AB4305_30185 [Nocardia sp. 2YAB30]|uniref:hypothetical protein n=1 Tax=Nocardia sp. 2YAB30 TaxID=3233022 RepID=UPI003F96464B